MYLLLIIFIISVIIFTYKYLNNITFFTAFFVLKKGCNLIVIIKPTSNLINLLLDNKYFLINI